MFVEEIRGSYSGIMGAPSRSAALLREFGYSLTERRTPAPTTGRSSHPAARAAGFLHELAIGEGPAVARPHPSPFALATMSDEYLINFTPEETRVALMQQGVVQEVHVERSASRGIVGNIYLGRVVRVLPGMQSAFMDVGLERTAFLHVADISVRPPRRPRARARSSASSPKVRP